MESHNAKNNAIYPISKEDNLEEQLKITSNTVELSESTQNGSFEADFDKLVVSPEKRSATKEDQAIATTSLPNPFSALNHPNEPKTTDINPLLFNVPKTPAREKVIPIQSPSPSVSDTSDSKNSQRNASQRKKPKNAIEQLSDHWETPVRQKYARTMTREVAANSYEMKNEGALNKEKLKECFDKTSKMIAGKRIGNLTTAIGIPSKAGKIWIARQGNKTLDVGNAAKYTKDMIEIAKDVFNIEFSSANDLFIDAVITRAAEPCHHAEMVILSALIDSYDLRDKMNEMTESLDKVMGIDDFKTHADEILKTLKKELKNKAGNITICSDAPACKHCAGMLKALDITFSKSKTGQMKPSNINDARSKPSKPGLYGWWNPITGNPIDHSERDTDQFQASELLWIKQKDYNKILEGIQDPIERDNRRVNREKKAAEQSTNDPQRPRSRTFPPASQLAAARLSSLISPTRSEDQQHGRPAVSIDSSLSEDKIIANTIGSPSVLRSTSTELSALRASPTSSMSSSSNLFSNATPEEENLEKKRKKLLEEKSLIESEMLKLTARLATVQHELSDIEKQSQNDVLQGYELNAR